jgi:hypothetical protein
MPHVVPGALTPWFYYSSSLSTCKRFRRSSKKRWIELLLFHGVQILIHALYVVATARFLPRSSICAFVSSKQSSQDSPLTVTEPYKSLYFFLALSYGNYRVEVLIFHPRIH